MAKGLTGGFSSGGEVVGRMTGQPDAEGGLHRLGGGWLKF